MIEEKTKSAAVQRIMAWTSANRRALRLLALALGAMFSVGLVLLFWAPWIGALLMLAAVLPAIVMAVVAVTLLAHTEAVPKQPRTKNKT